MTMTDVYMAKQENALLNVNLKAVNFLETYYIRMGWVNQLPPTLNVKREMLAALFKGLTYENPYHPREIPFNIVIPEFLNACRSGIIEEVYPNEASHLKAFKDWIPHNLVKLRRKYEQISGVKYDPDTIGQLHAKPIQKQLSNANQ